MKLDMNATKPRPKLEVIYTSHLGKTKMKQWTLHSSASPAYAMQAFTRFLQQNSGYSGKQVNVELCLCLCELTEQPLRSQLPASDRRSLEEAMEFVLGAHLQHHPLDKDLPVISIDLVKLASNWHCFTPDLLGVQVPRHKR